MKSEDKELKKFLDMLNEDIELPTEKETNIFNRKKKPPKKGWHKDYKDMVKCIKF